MDNHVIIIFGGSGDLTKRKLIPALYKLYEKGAFGSGVKILGVGRTNFSDEQYREHLKKSIEKDGDGFFSNIFYLSADPALSETYNMLKKRLFEFNETNYLFYLATPPSLYETIPLNLKGVALNLEGTEMEGRKSGSRRIIVEKPFCYDLESAVKMNSVLKSVFDESQIYRIDHYLGKIGRASCRERV